MVPAGRRWACRPAPLPLRRPAPSVAAPRRLAPLQPGGRHVPERPRSPSCGRRGMDPQEATGQGSGEPSARQVPSAEVSATGWGARAPATPRAGSRGARALREGRSPGKRRLPPLHPKHAQSLAGNGRRARGPRVVAGTGGRERETEAAPEPLRQEWREGGAGGRVRWERRGNGFFF